MHICSCIEFYLKKLKFMKQNYVFYIIFVYFINSHKKLKEIYELPTEWLYYKNFGSSQDKDALNDSLPAGLWNLLPYMGCLQGHFTRNKRNGRLWQIFWMGFTMCSQKHLLAMQDEQGMYCSIGTDFFSQPLRSEWR